jgi:hypothetical protein
MHGRRSTVLNMGAPALEWRFRWTPGVSWRTNEKRCGNWQASSGRHAGPPPSPRAARPTRAGADDGVRPSRIEVATCRRKDPLPDPAPGCGGILQAECVGQRDETGSLADVAVVERLDRIELGHKGRASFSGRKVTRSFRPLPSRTRSSRREQSRSSSRRAAHYRSRRSAPYSRLAMRAGGTAVPCKNGPSSLPVRATGSRTGRLARTGLDCRRDG